MIVVLRDDVIVLIEKLYETSNLADQMDKIIGILGFGSLVAGVRVEEKRTLYLSDFDVAPLLTSQTLHKLYSTWPRTHSTKSYQSSSGPSGPLYSAVIL